MSEARSQSRRGDVRPHGLRVVRDEIDSNEERRAGGPIQGRAGAPAPSLSPLHKRLWIAAGDKSIREIARIAKCHPETARRYFRGHQPSVEFVIHFCSALNVRIDWLLLGEGPQFPDELIDWAARSPEFPDLVRRAFDLPDEDAPRSA